MMVSECIYIFEYRRIFIKLLQQPRLKKYIVINDLSSKFISYCYIVIVFLFSSIHVLLPLYFHEKQRYREPSRRIRENRKKRGWVVKKKNAERRRWRIRKPASHSSSPRTNKSSEENAGMTWRDEVGEGERTGCYLLAIFFHSFLDLSLSEGPCPPHPFTERTQRT